MPDAVFFDFDGVLVDSVGVKSEAMRQLFSAERPEHIAAIVDLHERLGGISRYRKFELAFEDILKRPLGTSERDRLGLRFSEFAVEAVITAPMIDGALRFIDLHHRQLDLFVVSGTPEEELAYILDRRGLKRFFVAACGTPRTKPDIVRALLAERHLNPRDTVFVGDALTDWNAAQDCGVPFVGIVAPGRENPFDPSVRVLPDLTGLALALEVHHDTAALMDIAPGVNT